MVAKSGGNIFAACGLSLNAFLILSLDKTDPFVPQVSFIVEQVASYKASDSLVAELWNT
jgi:hypothetical protein